MLKFFVDVYFWEQFMARQNRRDLFDPNEAREAILKGRSGYRTTGWPELEAEAN